MVVSHPPFFWLFLQRGAEMSLSEGNQRACTPQMPHDRPARFMYAIWTNVNSHNIWTSKQRMLVSAFGKLFVRQKVKTAGDWFLSYILINNGTNICDEHDCCRLMWRWVIHSVNTQLTVRGNCFESLLVTRTKKNVWKRSLTNNDRANKARSDWWGYVGSVGSLLIHDKLRACYFSSSR